MTTVKVACPYCAHDLPVDILKLDPAPILRKCLSCRERFVVDFHIEVTYITSRVETIEEEK